MSHTTLVMYIHFFTSSQDAIDVDATYHQLLTLSLINHKNVTVQLKGNVTHADRTHATYWQKTRGYTGMCGK